MVLHPHLSRRRFVQGIAAAGVLAALDKPAHADNTNTILTGDEFHLTIGAQPVNITGKRSTATTINASMPCPILRWQEGDTVSIAVTNRLKEPTSIHWHGIRCPSDMDGVPGLSFDGIMPGDTFTYRFPVVQCGSYWYHSHSHFQEQTGLIGGLIIDPRHIDPIQSDRDYVILLSDWTDADPASIYSNLKKQSDYYNYSRRTAGTFISDVKAHGLHAAISDRLAWGRMNMSPTDLADVTAATYTYLINGRPPAANWTALFDRGQRIRLRFINGSSMTFFDVRIPGLTMSVVAADGNPVHPVQVDEFRIGIAEVFDVLVEPPDNRPYTIFAQPLSRDGYARATLAPFAGMAADIPPLDPRPMRTMADMGMNMEHMNMDMSGQGMRGKAMSGMQGMRHDSGQLPATQDHDMLAINTSTIITPATYGTEPLPQPSPGTPRSVTASQSAPAPTIVSRRISTGPANTTVVASPREQLNDPGDGLAGNGRRVLTYADLRALYPGVDGRAPTRQIELHLTGNMERYIWGFDGYRFSQAEPLRLKLGERVRLVLINDTMMEHPIHLHGLWGEIENGHGPLQPYKHTITIKPAERLSYLVSADTPGHWAYHCHLLYHMEAGMFRTVIVA
jgi:CopA family copper-resistance protein